MLYSTVYSYIAVLHKEKYNLEMIVAGGYNSFKIHTAAAQVMVEPDLAQVSILCWWFFRHSKMLFSGDNC